MDITLLGSNKPPKTALKIILLFLASIGIILAIYYFLPVGQDWNGIRTVILEMLAGRSPFTIKIFNPPWILLLLAPVALLPVKVGAALLSFLNIAVYGYAALRMGKSPWLAALLLITPPMIRQIVDPNLEFLIAAGLVLPPQIGIFLILAKPQLGAFVALFWAIETWREAGLWKTIKLFTPFMLVTLVSFAFYGLWPLRGFGLIGSTVNASMWPTSIIFGIPLLFYAFQTRQMNIALLSTPFLVPYYGFYSLHVPLLGLLPRRTATVAAVIGFWIAFLFGLH